MSAIKETWFLEFALDLFVSNVLDERDVIFRIHLNRVKLLAGQKTSVPTCPR